MLFEVVVKICACIIKCHMTPSLVATQQLYNNLCGQGG